MEPLHTPPRARAQIPHRASPTLTALQPLQPGEALLAAAACLTTYQVPASARRTAGHPRPGRWEAKEVLEHLVARVVQRAHGSVLLHGLRMCFRKECLNPVCTRQSRTHTYSCTSHTPRGFGSLPREALPRPAFGRSSAGSVTSLVPKSCAPYGGCL
eukprot:366483-Chlamydomonas_euryale.AAC.3